MGSTPIVPSEQKYITLEPVYTHMSYKDPEKQRIFCRDWARKKATEKRGGLPLPPRLTPDERHVNHRRSAKQHRDNQLEIIGNLIGFKCALCESEYEDTHKMVCHRKDGTPHNCNGGNCVKDVIKEPKEFVRLCRYCHNGAHWMMKTFKMSWDDILQNKLKHP